MEKSNILMNKEDKGIIRWVTVVAVAVPIVVAILLFMPSKIDFASDWVYFLPHFNAIINSAASVALIFGLIFIKNKNITLHRASMTTAFVLGAIFLVSYVIYHAAAESTTFGGQGLIKSVYYFILITHILLAAVALFPILLAYYYGHTDQRAKHKKVVKFAYPIWLYVTISGVIVYLMISPYYNF
jgi:putative membrane protein